VCVCVCVCVRMWRFAFIYYVCIICVPLLTQTQNNENNQKIIQDIDVGTLVSPSVSNDQHRRKRVLVYCMQSSGCSIFMMVLGQKLRSLTIVDLYIVDPVPDVIDSQGSDDVDWYVLKMTFRGVERGGEQLDYKKHLDEIKAIYRPDISVLYMRHPGDNLISLRKHSDPKVPINYDHSDTCNTRQKPSWVSGYAYRCVYVCMCQYALHTSCVYGLGCVTCACILPHQYIYTYIYKCVCRCGDPESKLRNLEMMWSSRDAEFDAVFTYHDLHFGQQMLVDKMTSLGFEMQSDAFQLKRGIQEIMKFAHSNFKSSNKVRFGPGGIPNHAVGITKDGFHTYAPYTAEVTQIMQEQCPTVFAHFQSLEVPSKQH
jgi:hypothetical protein